ncbi:AAA family ATPase [Rhodovibrionaceae bacterium A322]
MGILALSTMKGGSGKSTVAICLAAEWLKQGKSVALIDTDPQASVLRWRESGEDLQALTLEKAEASDIEKHLHSLKDSGIDRIVVDTPGFRAEVTEKVLALADLALVPLKASPVDFEVAADTVDMIRRISDKRQKGKSKAKALEFRFLLSQTVRDSVISRHMRDELKQAGYPLMKVELINRVLYSEAALLGSAPCYMAPRSQAAKEVKSLAKELDPFLKQ